MQALRPGLLRTPQGPCPGHGPEGRSPFYLPVQQQPVQRATCPRHRHARPHRTGAGQLIHRKWQRLLNAWATSLLDRGEGIRVKHRAEENSIKMYNKQGSVLRIETTINNVRRFRVRRMTTWNKVRRMRWVPMRARSGGSPSVPGRAGWTIPAARLHQPRLAPGAVAQAQGSAAIAPSVRQDHAPAAAPARAWIDPQSQPNALLPRDRSRPENHERFPDPSFRGPHQDRRLNKISCHKNKMLYLCNTEDTEIDSAHCGAGLLSHRFCQGHTHIAHRRSCLRVLCVLCG
jgi:hypothetical protein